MIKSLIIIINFFKNYREKNKLLFTIDYFKIK